MTINHTYHTDALSGLKELPAESIDCCVTSPPYWGLRDYGVSGQLGLEETPELFVEKMVEVFEEVRRVLKKEGTLWLNIGDSYASRAQKRTDKQVNGATSTITGKDNQLASAAQPNKLIGDLKPKDLVGIPWMLAFALRSTGWYLRQEIIWYKTNPMPESVRDRCTKSHESIFLLSKSRHYYFDQLAIATDYKEKTLTTWGTEIKMHGDGSGLIKSENFSRDIPKREPKQWKTPDGWDTDKGSHGSFHRKGREKGRKGYKHRGEKADQNFRSHSGYYDSDGNLIGSRKANKRSVWTVATQSFKEAHFATFPPKLIVDCIKAGCPEGGIVLDPFMGACTTGLVARKLNRNYIGIELNADYIEIGNRRLARELGMFQ